MCPDHVNLLWTVTLRSHLSCSPLYFTVRNSDQAVNHCIHAWCAEIQSSPHIQTGLCQKHRRQIEHVASWRDKDWFRLKQIAKHQFQLYVTMITTANKTHWTYPSHPRSNTTCTDAFVLIHEPSACAQHRPQLCSRNAYCRPNFTAHHCKHNRTILTRTKKETYRGMTIWWNAAYADWETTELSACNSRCHWTYHYWHAIVICATYLSSHEPSMHAV